MNMAAGPIEQSDLVGRPANSRRKGLLAMTLVTVEVPDMVLATMRNSPEQFTREMRLAAAATWYGQGRVSQEMAARIAGLNRTDFLLALARMGRESFEVDFADLDRELARG